MNKVHVSWKIPDIAATVTIDKKWNTETLAWDTVNTTDSAEDATAEFTFVNISSEKTLVQTNGISITIPLPKKPFFMQNSKSRAIS